MYRCKITLTANAGVMIECGGIKMFCDALHRNKTNSFSTVSPDMQLYMAKSPEFQNADIMFFTHKHPDHYSHFLIERAKLLTPGALLVSPVSDFQNQVLLCETNHDISLGNTHFFFRKLQHDGKQYINLPNYGCLIDFDGFKVLVVGDCVVGEPILAEWLKEVRVDLALLNFPWLTLRRGRGFIEQYIKPQHLMFYHLPFAKDDKNGFRAAASKSLSLLSAPGDVRLLQDPFQVEMID